MVDQDVLEKFEQAIALIKLPAAEMTVLGIYLHKSAEKPIPMEIDIEGIIGEKVRLAVENKAGNETAAMELNLLDHGELGAALVLRFGLPIISNDLGILMSAAETTGELTEEYATKSASKASVEMTFSADDFRAIMFCLEDPYLAAKVSADDAAKKSVSEAIRAAVGDKQGKQGIGFELDLRDEKIPVYLSTMAAACRVLIDIVNDINGQIQEIMKHTQIVPDISIVPGSPCK